MKLKTLEATMREGTEAQHSAGVTVLAIIVVAAATMLPLIRTGAPWWQMSLFGLMVVGTASYSWNSWHESKDLRATYQDRLNELLESTWCSVSFASRDEAIAFVAELSARLPAPIEYPESHQEDIEVSVRVRDEDSTVYLSDGALRAFGPDFPAPANMKQVQGKSLTLERVPVIIGAPAKPLPRAEIIRRLEGKHPRGEHHSLRLTRPM